MNKQSRQVTSRVPVTPQTLDELKEFRNGLGGSYDDAIKMLLMLARGNETDLYIAGRNMRTADTKETSNE